MKVLYSMSDTCALAPHIALAWSDQPYRVRILANGENHEPDYLAINPLGSVPALELYSGEILIETAAILTYIDALSPDAFRAPARKPAAQAELSSWLSFLSSELQVAFSTFFNPGRFSPDPDHHQELKDQAQSRIAFLLHHAQERFQGPYVFGEHRSVADPYLFVICRWIGNTFIDIEAYSKLASFKRHMNLDADVLDVLGQYH
jgi:glutathione S-transferase